MNEIIKEISVEVTTTESQVDICGSNFLISSDVDLYIGADAATFFIPAKTVIGTPLSVEKLKIKGSSTGNAYILFIM